MTDYMALMDRWAGEHIRYEIEGTLEDLPCMLASTSYNFRDDLYPRLSAIDEQIPGVGMQYAHWEGITPRFPFAEAFDAVVRPLSYVPYHLAAPMAYSVMAREVVNDSGAHIEQCVKKLCITGRNRRRSLGQVINSKRAVKRLGVELVEGITQYTPSWNAAKHDYEGSGPESVITLDDAIRNYFAARSLGAAVLKATGSLSGAVQAIEDAANNRVYYRRGCLLDSQVRPLPQIGSDSAVDSGNHSGTQGHERRRVQPELGVTPVDVVVTPSFAEWLSELPYAVMVAVAAAVERLAAYGRRLGLPEVERVITRAFPETFILVPEPPAVGRAILFAFDPMGRAVLVEGDYGLGKRKRFRAAVRRYRRSRKWIRLVAGPDLLPFTEVVAHLTDEDRAEVSAMRACAAATSAMLGDMELRDARQRIQLELDYLAKRPEPGIDDALLSDNWLLRHSRYIAAQIGYGDAVLESLPGVACGCRDA
ncbi:MAG: hypothetical protein OXJ36_18880 [bacterium]|nr:hypothetical protein [bacterium]MDE0440424.1 hypothetical protein [bacterium]